MTMLLSGPASGVMGAQFDGPAIVEQPDTTTVVYPGFTCRVDAAGNLLLTKPWALARECHADLSAVDETLSRL